MARVQIPRAQTVNGRYIAGMRITAINYADGAGPVDVYTTADGSTPVSYPLVSGAEGVFTAYADPTTVDVHFDGDDDLFNNPERVELISGESDPPVAEAGLRTLGAGARQAAPGNHVHPVANIGTRFGTSKGICSGPGSTAPSSVNRLFLLQIDVYVPCTITGIIYSVGGTSNGNVMSALYSFDGVDQLGISATGVAQGTANLPQNLPFTTPAVLDEAGQFIAAVAFASITATFFGARLLLPATSVSSGFPPPADVIASVPSTTSTGTMPLLSTY